MSEEKKLSLDEMEEAAGGIGDVGSVKAGGDATVVDQHIDQSIGKAIDKSTNVRTDVDVDVTYNKRGLF